MGVVNGVVAYKEGAWLVGEWAWFGREWAGLMLMTGGADEKGRGHVGGRG